jgi:hypothetical protein
MSKKVVKQTETKESCPLIRNFCTVLFGSICVVGPHLFLGGSGIRIQIQLFTSIRIRIQEAKPIRIYPDPGGPGVRYKNYNVYSSVVHISLIIVRLLLLRSSWLIFLFLYSTISLRKLPQGRKLHKKLKFLHENWKVYKKCNKSRWTLNKDVFRTFLPQFIHLLWCHTRHFITFIFLIFLTVYPTSSG